MKDLKEIIKKCLKETPNNIPVIYATSEFWEEVDREIVKRMKNGSCI